MNDRDLGVALEERRLDVVLTFSNAVWPHATTLPIHRDHLVAALPLGRSLARRTTVTWDDLGHETCLVQGWDESQVARDLYASLIGERTKFPDPPRQQTVGLRTRCRRVRHHAGHCQSGGSVLPGGGVQIYRRCACID